MFDTIDGLPVHALVVHAVVVLLPLALLGTIAIAVRPAWRARFGPLPLDPAEAPDPPATPAPATVPGASVTPLEGTPRRRRTHQEVL